MFSHGPNDIDEWPRIAIGAIAVRIGVWNLQLNSYAELRDLVGNKSPALLSAFDKYYEILWRCESAAPERLNNLNPKRDMAHAELLEEIEKSLAEFCLEPPDVTRDQR